MLGCKLSTSLQPCLWLSSPLGHPHSFITPSKDLDMALPSDGRAQLTILETSDRPKVPCWQGLERDLADRSRPIHVKKPNELAQSNCPHSLWLCKLLPNSGCAVVLPGVLVVTQFSGSSPRDGLIQCVLGEAEESGFLVNISGDLDPARNRAAIWELLSRGTITGDGTSVSVPFKPHCLCCGLFINRFQNTELKGSFSWEMCFWQKQLCLLRPSKQGSRKMTTQSGATTPPKKTDWLG